MTNEQKYKTIEERVSEFQRFCYKQEECTKCAAVNNEGTKSFCAFRWLALEAEEEPEPCPFCEGKCSAETVKTEDLETGEVCSEISVLCYGKDGVGCGYQSKFFTEEAEAISAHNRVCRAVEAIKKGDVK